MTPWNTSNRQTRNSTSQTTDLIGSQKRLIPSVTKSEKQLVMTILVRTRFLNLSIPKEKVVFSVMESDTNKYFLFFVIVLDIYLAAAINSSYLIDIENEVASVKFKSTNSMRNADVVLVTILCSFRT